MRVARSETWLNFGVYMAFLWTRRNSGFAIHINCLARTPQETAYTITMTRQMQVLILGEYWRKKVGAVFEESSSSYGTIRLHGLRFARCQLCDCDLVQGVLKVDEGEQNREEEVQTKMHRFAAVVVLEQFFAEFEDDHDVEKPGEKKTEDGDEGCYGPVKRTG